MSDKHRSLRVHGDNIVECERTLHLLAEALDAKSVEWLASPVYAPLYRIRVSANLVFNVQLLPGYGRWEAALAVTLRSLGAPLAEAADSVVTEVVVVDQAIEERLLLAIEFCGALPAGNNAWQRCGRSYSYAVAGIPYLYISELGGRELDADRRVKATRMPNPLVPFGYLAQSDLSETFALALYEPSPSIDEGLRTQYEATFARPTALKLIAAVIGGLPYQAEVREMQRKGLELVKKIAGERRGAGVLKGTEWDQLLELREDARMEHLARRSLQWSKRVSIPVTDTFQRLLSGLSAIAVAAGSSDMPLCIVDGTRRGELSDAIRRIYGRDLRSDATQWLATSTAPLAVAIVAGFKPQGEDSRPDRGLLPLARMILGEKAEVLTVVYGPASTSMWMRYRNDPQALAESNGLWQSVLELSDIVLVDSTTSGGPDLRRTDRQQSKRPKNRKDFQASMKPAKLVPSFGEHDVDSLLKMMASGAPDLVFEGLCNPPGGDWSGISFRDFRTGMEYRWTSLPRVTSRDGKRPDHVLQVATKPVPTLLSIESKERERDFEAGIGPRLTKYVNDLTRTPPNIRRRSPDSQWMANDSGVELAARIISGGAFIHSGGVKQLREVAAKHELDVVIGVQFGSDGIAHVSVSHRKEVAEAIAGLIAASERLGNWVVIQIDAF